MKYGNVEKVEAVNHMQDMVMNCDNCNHKNREVCCFHKAEIRELQYEFTWQIPDDILEYLEEKHGDE